MKSVLMYHEGSSFERDLLLPWLDSFSDVVGVVVVENKFDRKLDRLRAEYHRNGLTGTADAIAFRLYDPVWKTDRRAKIRRLVDKKGSEYDGSVDPPTQRVETPNSEPTRRFLREREPDIAIARVKLLLDEAVFSIPSTGTFAIHPGVCPEYRNAHGCFWAIAEDDHENVGYTLLKIDSGVDTGPIYAQGGTEFDPLEDHIYLQLKMIADNLDEIRSGLEGAHQGDRDPLDTSGRESEVWGQPKLTDQLRLVRRERKRKETAQRTICLLYHDIVPDHKSSTSGLNGSSVGRYKLSPTLFESHLKRIVKQSAPVRTIDECRPHRADSGIYLTFDDGGDSLFKYAAPLLEKYGMHGHMSVITDRIGEDGFLDREQVAELARRGHHIMSHTVSHLDLLSCDPSVREREIEESKSELEEITGRDCVSLSIPGGRYDEAVLQAARDAGYEYVFISDPEIDPADELGWEVLTLGRWNVWNSTDADELEAMLHQDFIKTSTIRARWRVLKTVKGLIGMGRFIKIRDTITN
jgi:hypothetical protein